MVPQLAMPPPVQSSAHRRLAAALTLNAVRNLAALHSPTITNDEYFEALEALVWLKSGECLPFLEVINVDQSNIDRVLDLTHLSDIVLYDLAGYREYLLRMYAALGRRMAAARNRQITSGQLSAYAASQLESSIKILQAPPVTLG